MGSAICGGTISWTKWKKLSPEEAMGHMMSFIRKRVLYRGHYRYKILDPLGGIWWWEDEKRIK